MIKAFLIIKFVIIAINIYPLWYKMKRPDFKSNFFQMYFKITLTHFSQRLFSLHSVPSLVIFVVNLVESYVLSYLEKTPIVSLSFSFSVIRSTSLWSYYTGSCYESKNISCEKVLFFVFPPMSFNLSTANFCLITIFVSSSNSSP